jgi:hypothetical protein
MAYRFLILLILFLSCTERADFNLDYEDSLVLDLFLTTDSTINFIPKKTADFYSVENNELLTDLQFDFSSDSGLLGTIVYNPKIKSYSANFAIDYGHSYEINCIYKEEQIYSKTTVPKPVSINNLEVIPLAYRNSRDWPYNQVTLEINDPVGENYYMVYIKCQTYFNQNYFDPGLKDSLYKHLLLNSHLRSQDPVILAEPYFPHTVLDEQKTFPFLIFSDRLFDGKKYTFQFFYESPIYTGGLGIFMYAHVPEIALLSIHPDIYEYLSTYIQHMDNRIGNLLSGRLEPINVKGNIENGQGIFSSYSRSVDTSLFFDRDFIETGTIHTNQ